MEASQNTAGALKLFGCLEKCDELTRALLDGEFEVLAQEGTVHFAFEGFDDRVHSHIVDGMERLTHRRGVR